jgi:hypothetical protein
VRGFAFVDLCHKRFDVVPGQSYLNVRKSW